MPGASEVVQLWNTLTSGDLEKGIERYASDFFTSRGEPAFLKNMQKNRWANRLFFGAHGVETEKDVQDDEDIAEEQKQKRFSILND